MTNYEKNGQKTQLEKGIDGMEPQNAQDLQLAVIDKITEHIRGIELDPMKIDKYEAWAPYFRRSCRKVIPRRPMPRFQLYRR